MTIIVTGGLGFIGTNFINSFVENNEETIINIDYVTYASNQDLAISKIDQKNNYKFIKGNISDKDLVKQTFKKYNPRAIINFAAESHVDRSINSPDVFIDSNIKGTFNLLKVSYDYWTCLNSKNKDNFRFIQISTDEVYGSLESDEMPSTEESSYKPSSPYSASKASADHLVQAWHKTYSFPTIISNCTNNFGPYQHNEKLIPLIITNALNKNSLPIYGDGNQIRDWLYVKDHCNAINILLDKGVPGETYNIGSSNEIKNIDLVKNICSILDVKVPLKSRPYSSLIKFVKDRPGHDTRYALNSSKIKKLGWHVEESFVSRLNKTIQWYIEKNSF